MQVGLPIISTNNGGQTDLIQDGKNGFLVEYGKLEELNFALNKIIYGRLNKKYHLQEFNINKISNSYLTL